MKRITFGLLMGVFLVFTVFSNSVFAAENEGYSFFDFLTADDVSANDDVVGVEYRGHIENTGDYPLDGTWLQGPEQLGTVEQGLRLEGFWIKLVDAPEGIHIQYSVHVENEGWMDSVSDGDFAGTEDKSERIEAIKIQLINDDGSQVTDYSVEYKGHIQDQGDTQWFSDGEELGTTGLGKRLEALEVQIVKVSTQDGSDLSAYQALIEKIDTTDHSEYTTESWMALTEAVNNYQATEEDTQETIDQAVIKIEAAYQALVKIPAISEFSVTGVKSMEISFNTAVDDESVAISVIKDSGTDCTISSVFWNDNHSVATLLMGSKIREGAYTVTVSGLTDEDLAASVGAEDERVESIVITSEQAVLQSSEKSVTAAYQILNQYGEDITDSISESVLDAHSNKGDVELDDGIAEISYAEDSEKTFEIDEEVRLTIYNDDGVSASKELVIGDLAGVDDIIMGQVYNETGLAFSLDNSDESFYLVVEITDQYRNVLDADDLNGQDRVRASSTDESVISLADEENQFADLDLDGDGIDESLGLELIVEDEGSSTIRIVSLYNGELASEELTIGALTEVDEISLTQPDIAVVGETVVIPFEAVNTDGSESTLLSEFSNVTATLSLSDSFVDESEASIAFKRNSTTGAVELQMDLDDLENTEGEEGGTAKIFVTTNTGNTASLKVDLEEKAVPVAVSGLSSYLSLNPAIDGEVAVYYSYVNYIDQFDRCMSYKLVPDSYKIIVTVDDDSVVSMDSDTIYYPSYSYVTLTGLKKGSTNITFTLYNDDTIVDDGEYTTKVTVAGISQFVSYELSTVGTIYDDSTLDDTDFGDGYRYKSYARDIQVYGITSSGKEVVLPNTDFNVVFSGQEGLEASIDLASSSYPTTAWGLGVAEGYAESPIAYSSDETEAYATVYVTINDTGDSLSQDIIISNAEPVVSSISCSSSKVISSVYTLTEDNFDTSDVLSIVSYVYDSYAMKASLTAENGAQFLNTELYEPVYVTFSDIYDADDEILISIEANGSNTASMSDVENGDEFTVTVSFANGASKSFCVEAEID